MTDSLLHRRSFLARLGLSAAAMPAVAAACQPNDTKAAASTMKAPAAADELATWCAAIPGTQKVIYDCVEPAGGPNGILFARNFLTFSKSKLNTPDNDMGVIVSFRHLATPYGYNDAMWAKYPQFAALLKVDDPKTKKPATRNVPLHDEVEGFSDATITALGGKGVKFTVCGAANEFIAGILAGKTGDAKAVEAELAANLVPNARIVPAGVVVLQHAQKAGFAYTHAG